MEEEVKNGKPRLNYLNLFLNDICYCLPQNRVSNTICQVNAVQLAYFILREGVLWMASPNSEGKRSMDDFVVVLRVTKKTTG